MLAVLVVGLVATALVGQGRRAQMRDQFDDRYAAARVESLAELQANVDRYASIVSAASAFIVSSEQVTNREFEQFGRNLDAAAIADGVESIGFLEPVPWEERDRVAAEIAEHRPGFELQVGDVPRPLVFVTRSSSGPDHPAPSSPPTWCGPRHWNGHGYRERCP
jgi:CHASE1-domain containing sensor protein